MAVGAFMVVGGVGHILQITFCARSVAGRRVDAELMR